MGRERRQRRHQHHHSPANQTQGELLVAGAGNRQTLLAARHGASTGGVDWRLYAKRVDLRHTATATDAAVNDASQFSQVGFRADRKLGDDHFTLQGDAYRGQRDQPLPGSIAIAGVKLDLGTIALAGANVLARWDRRLGGDASLTLQAYYDHTQRTIPPTFAQTLDIVDLQLQHTFKPGAAHTLAWGAALRHAMDDVTNSVYIAFLPARLNQTWASVFAQDEIALQGDLRLTLGARLERNDYTGVEWLPNLRLAWKPAVDHLLWAGASRTVRAPSRLDRDTFVPGQAPFVLTGGPGVRSETARVYELGYRGQPTPASSLSVSVFHGDYDHLRSQELAASRSSVFFANGMQGTVRGLEAWGSYQLGPAWRVHGGYSRLLQRLELKPGSTDSTSVAGAQGANPGRQWRLRSAWDLTRQVELDATMRYVAALGAPRVPSYLALDARLAWRLQPKV